MKIKELLHTISEKRKKVEELQDTLADYEQKLINLICERKQALTENYNYAKYRYFDDIEIYSDRITYGLKEKMEENEYNHYLELKEKYEHS